MANENSRVGTSARKLLKSFGEGQGLTAPEGFLEDEGIQEGVEQVAESMEDLITQIKSHPDFEPLVVIQQIVAEILPQEGDDVSEEGLEAVPSPEEIL